MKTELGLNNHWIIFGVSYSGALVAWARAAYPHIFHAAYSSSAPILAQADFGEYHEVTGIAQAETDPECPIYVSEGMNELQRLITEGGASLDYVSELFYICEPGLNASSSLDITTLNSMVANFFGALVQYAGSDGQKNTCNKIMNGPGTTLENMAEIVKEGYLGMCLTTDYNIVMDYYRTITAWEPINIVRQWLYTACTELGWFTPLSTPDSPFGQLFPVDYFTQWCTDIYGPTFTPQLLEEGIQRTNTIRGGLTPEVTRVLYTHGTLDQYHRLGANKDLGPDTPVIMIEGSSHSSDMGWNVSSDSAALR